MGARVGEKSRDELLGSRATTQHHHSYPQCSVQKASDDSDGGDDTTPGFFALVGETQRRGKWCHRVDSQRRAQPWIGAVEGMSTVRNLC